MSLCVCVSRCIRCVCHHLLFINALNMSNLHCSFYAWYNEEKPTHEAGARLCRSVVDAIHSHGIWAIGHFQTCVSEGYIFLQKPKISLQMRVRHMHVWQALFMSVVLPVAYSLGDPGCCKVSRSIHGPFVLWSCGLSLESVDAVVTFSGGRNTDLLNLSDWMFGNESPEQIAAEGQVAVSWLLQPYWQLRLFTFLVPIDAHAQEHAPSLLTWNHAQFLSTSYNDNEFNL